MSERILYSVALLADIFGVSERRIQQLVKDNIMVKAARGKYDLIACVRGYVRYQNELIPNKQSHEAGAVIARIDIDAERAQLIKHQARIAKQTADENDGILVSKKDEEKAAFKIARNLRNVLTNMPNRISHEIAADTDVDSVYARLNKEVIDSLVEVSAMMDSEDTDETPDLSFKIDIKPTFLLPVDIDADCSHWLWVK